MQRNFKCSKEMGGNELNKERFNNQDKMLVTIMVGFGLFIAYNIWGEDARDYIIEITKYSFHF